MRQSPHRILCVDSSASRRYAIARALENAGFRVWTAGTVKDAVSMALGLRFDAVVADREASSRSPSVWDHLRETQPLLPVFIHSRGSTLPGSGDRPDGVTLEMILAVLTILLNTRVSAPVPGMTAA